MPVPDVAEQTNAAEPSAEATEEVATDTEVSPDTTQPEVVEPVAEAEAPAPAAPFEKCMVGPVEARVGRVPLGAVLGLLSPDGLRRIEAEKSSASFESTCKRLLATDGRATPVVFAEAATPDESPSILHGYAELAAAEVSGASDVTVLLIPAGGASDAQAHIVEMVRQQRMSDQPSNDDELFYRVHADG